MTNKHPEQRMTKFIQKKGPFKNCFCFFLPNARWQSQLISLTTREKVLGTKPKKRDIFGICPTNIDLNTTYQIIVTE